MRLYLDDDVASALLAQLLQRANHDVQRPVDAGMSGRDDPIHLAHAIQDGRVLLSQNHRDFENLHELVLLSGGNHPGILIVRKDNDPKRDLSERAIVRALGRFQSAGIQIANSLHVLNHWR